MDTQNTQALGNSLPTEKHEHTQAIIAIITILILGGAFALGFWFVEKASIESVETFETGEVLTTAKENKVVPGFPKELLPQEGEIIAGSYALKYPSGLNQPVVEYQSSKTMRALVEGLEAQFKATGWAIVSSADPESLTITSMYGIKKGNETNFTLSQNTDGTIKVVAVFINNPQSGE